MLLIAQFDSSWMDRLTTNSRVYQIDLLLLKL
jgi:hypothetical protein